MSLVIFRGFPNFTHYAFYSAHTWHPSINLKKIIIKYLCGLHDAFPGTIVSINSELFDEICNLSIFLAFVFLVDLTQFYSSKDCLKIMYNIFNKKTRGKYSIEYIPLYFGGVIWHIGVLKIMSIFKNKIFSSDPYNDRAIIKNTEI